MSKFLALALTALLAFPLAAQEQPEGPDLPLVVGIWTCDADKQLRWRWVDENLSGVMWLILVDKRITQDTPCAQPYLVGEAYPVLGDFFTIIPNTAQQIAIREYLARERE